MFGSESFISLLLIFAVNISAFKIFPNLHGAIASNGLECAPIGMNVLKNGGSAVDAAISVLLCEGVTGPQSSGLGGGFVATIYIKANNLTECLDARESAPKAATQDMFVGDQNHSSLVGGRSIAVPGELKGMWELHKKYGKLPWKELIQPIIKLCNKYKVSKNLAHSLKEKEIDIKAEPTLREVFIDPSTNSVWNAGEYLTDLDLAETLKIISVEGAEALYGNGEIGKQLLKDIKSFGGILTAEDLKDYQVRWSKPVTTLLRNGKMLYTMPSPGAGPLLIFIINLLKSFEFKHDTISYHRIIEAFKLAYARRSELGDPEFVESVAELTKNLTNDQYADNMRKLIDDSTTHNDIQYYGGNFFVPEDHGTAHISVLAPNGDAVSLTSTVNFLFGSMRRSKTGIILNDEMDDFSTPGLKNVYGIPPSEANFIAPGKRPVSSMTPTIIVNPDGQVNMVIGAAGGSKITASVAYSIIQHYFIKPNASIDDLFATKRLHHQLIPNLLNFEEGFDPEIINGLMELNHTMQRISLDSGFSALTGIINEHDIISAAFDPRRGGSAEAFLCF